MKTSAEEMLKEFLYFLSIMSDEELEEEMRKAREDSKDSWIFEEEDETLY